MSPNWFDVRDYGAVGNGTTDDTAAILAAVAATPTRGGVVYVPPGSFKISDTILIVKPVTLIGDGHGYNGNSITNAPYLPTTEFLWSGPTAGTTLKVGYGLDSRPVAGVRLEGFSVNLGTGCAIGVELEGTQRSTVRDVTVRNPSSGLTNSIGLYMHAKSDEVGLNVNCAYNVIDGFAAAVVSTILKCDGSLNMTSNVCHNSFSRLQGVFGLNGSTLDGLDFGDSDNNAIYGTHLFRQPGGLGYGVRLRPRARGNYFYHLEASVGGLYSEGQINGKNNVIFGYDRGNNQPSPTLGPGALLSWVENGGTSCGWHILESLFVGGGSGISKTMSGSISYDPPSLPKGSQTSTTVPVVGTTWNDVVLPPSFSQDLQQLDLFGYVSAPDAVTCVFRNHTNGTVNLPSGTLKAIAVRG